MKKKEKLLSLRELNLSGRIYWIDSYPTLKKWVERDLKKKNILRTKKVGSGNSTRYYFNRKDVENFVKKFEAGDL